MSIRPGHATWLLVVVVVGGLQAPGWGANAMQPLATAPVPAPAPDPAPAIGDLLDHDNGRWTVSAGSYFDGGAYHVAKPSVTYAYDFGDGIAQIEAQHVSGVPNMAYGLAFRLSPSGPGGGPGGYYVRITANGVWALVRLDGFRLTYLIAPQASNLLGTGDGVWNTIGVVCSGDNITVLLNGQKAGTATDGTYREGGVGPLSVTSKLEAAFRDLTIDPSFAIR